jgi:hypothetical protein
MSRRDLFRFKSVEEPEHAVAFHLFCGRELSQRAITAQENPFGVPGEGQGERVGN